MTIRLFQHLFFIRLCKVTIKGIRRMLVSIELIIRAKFKNSPNGDSNKINKRISLSISILGANGLKVGVNKVKTD